jgi:hypothetical protein
VVRRLRSYATSVIVSGGGCGGASVSGSGACVCGCAGCSCNIKLLCPAGRGVFVGLCARFWWWWCGGACGGDVWVVELWLLCGCYCHRWWWLCGCLWWVGYLVRCGHGRGLCGGRLVCVRCGCGVLWPLTLRISYSICVDVLSNHIVHSCSNPVPFVFFTVIMSPLSCICSPFRLAYLYTSALLVYSVADKNKLHLSGPLPFLIAAYSLRRAVLEAHSITIR